MAGHWSGAKTVDGQVSMEKGLARTKSGRSDIPEDSKSLSMSCSDKILMWNCIGFQGSVLANFLEDPLHFSSIVIECENICPENNQTIRRGLVPRERQVYLNP